MDSLEIIFGVLSTILVCMIYLVKLIEKIKEVRKLENKDLILKELMDLIKLSEELFESGEEKKKFVVTRIKNFQLENKLKSNMDELEHQIESYIDLTNKVNIKKGEINEYSK